MRQEPGHGVDVRRGFLDERHVPAPLEDVELGVRDAVRDGLGRLDRARPVVTPREDEHRGSDLVETVSSSIPP